MQSTLLVRWRIASAAVPRVLLHCPRCERDRFFASSGRFRVNAQKKRLDAWLIYGCAVCGRTWNFPVFERRQVRDVDSRLLDRLHGNCAALAAERGSDLVALLRHVRAVEPVAVSVGKELIDGAGDAPLLRIVIACVGMQRLRLDRLLAAELVRSRSCIERWERKGVLVASPAQRFVRDGQQVRVILGDLPAADRAAVAGAAVGVTA